MSKRGIDEALDPSSIRAKLGALDPQAPLVSLEPPKSISSEQLAGLKDAGVLIPLSVHQDMMHVLLTRRASTLRNHSGEISFPGGRQDEGESLLQTALREAQEEVSLDPLAVRVFGHFSRVPTPSGFMIWSYVGEFDHALDLEHNPAEIDYLMRVPFDALVAPGVHRVELRQFAGRGYPIHYFDYGQQPIWGATAYMLYELLCYLGLLERAKIKL